MKGKVYKSEDKGWVVKYSFTPYNDYVVYQREILLHPDDVCDLIDLNNVFDNIEARVAAHPEVEFNWCVIVDHDTGKGVEYAKLVK